MRTLPFSSVITLLRLNSRRSSCSRHVLFRSAPHSLQPHASGAYRYGRVSPFNCFRQFFSLYQFHFPFSIRDCAFFILLLPKTIPLLLLVSEPSVAFDKYYCLFRFSKNTDKTSDKNCGKASFFPGFSPRFVACSYQTD